MLSPAASQHVGVVLRMQPGEALTLFCGDDREFSATILTVDKKKVTVTIDEAHSINRESSRIIHLAQAVSKGERMEWVIQKAVELGVTSITPLITAHCVVRLDKERSNKKQAQWQAIAIAACEQSGRTRVPTVHPLCSFENFLQENRASTNLILHPHATKTLKDITVKDDIALLIGPEGGLSEQEIHLAQNARFKAIRLGPRVLRTETAAIVALGVLQALSGDL